MPRQSKSKVEIGTVAIANRGRTVGIVLETKSFGDWPMVKIASVNGLGWIEESTLSNPRLNCLSELVVFYESCTKLHDRLDGLSILAGRKSEEGKAGKAAQKIIFELVTATAVQIAKQKRKHHDKRRVLLDFGERAGFSDEHMAEGRAHL